ncbi:cupin domain-containing protein [Herpetosiphon sp. NSE202]|uniref:cupin domain-containing protein n=1 Tax=Herpetosiphon sp. NSE202 TaxID=3351349 RepID=UPI0036421EA1
MSEPFMPIAVILPEQGTTLIGDIRCKVSSAATNNQCTVLEVTLLAGQGAVLHQHAVEMEILLVQAGRCTVGDERNQWLLEVGGIAHFPQNTRHFFRNDHPETCVLLITAIPGGLDRFFEALAAQAENAAQD